MVQKVSQLRSPSPSRKVILKEPVSVVSPEISRRRSALVTEISEPAFPSRGSSPFTSLVGEFASEEDAVTDYCDESGEDSSVGSSQEGKNKRKLMDAMGQLRQDESHRKQSRIVEMFSTQTRRKSFELSSTIDAENIVQSDGGSYDSDDFDFYSEMAAYFGEASSDSGNSPRNPADLRTSPRGLTSADSLLTFEIENNKCEEDWRAQKTPRSPRVELGSLRKVPMQPTKATTGRTPSPIEGIQGSKHFASSACSLVATGRGGDHYKAEAESYLSETVSKIHRRLIAMQVQLTMLTSPQLQADLPMFIEKAMQLFYQNNQHLLSQPSFNQQHPPSSNDPQDAHFNSPSTFTSSSSSLFEAEQRAFVDQALHLYLSQFMPSAFDGHSLQDE